MSNDSNDKHPSQLNDEELKALHESDPDAFDDDVAEDNAADREDAKAKADDTAGESKATGDDGEAKDSGDADEKSADGSENDASGKDAKKAGKQADDDDDGGSGKPPPDYIPRSRLNAALEKARSKDDVINQQAAELEQLRKRMADSAPPKDFDKEFDELLEKYDEGHIDDAQFERAKRDLQREEFDYRSMLASRQARQEDLQQAMQQEWDRDIKAFVADNEAFFKDEENLAVFQRAINSVAAFEGPNISNQDLLAKAGKMAFERLGFEAKVDPPGAGAESDTAKARRRQNAERVAAASGAPPAINGGVGDRGGPAKDIDLRNMKPGTFSKNLSKKEQEDLLGEGAA